MEEPIKIIINETTIETQIIDGHKYIEYTALMKEMFGSSYRAKIDHYNKELEDCFIKIHPKKYISMFGLSQILENVEDLDKARDVLWQLFHIKRPKQKLPYEIRLSDALKTLAELPHVLESRKGLMQSYSNACQDDYHDFENMSDDAIDDDYIALGRKLHDDRKKRRKAKNDVLCYKDVKKALNRLNIDFNRFMEIADKYDEQRADLQHRIDNNVYHRRYKKKDDTVIEDSDIEEEVETNEEKSEDFNDSYREGNNPSQNNLNKLIGQWRADSKSKY